MDNYCETAQVSLDLDPQGRHWEHFFVSGRYAFSNQIPNRQSFTTTNPGDVLAARGLCYWRGQAQQPPAMANTTTMAPGEGGAAGLLLVVGMVGSGIYAWMTRRNIDADPDYHPMADVPPLPLPPGLCAQPPSSQSVIGHPTLSQASDDGAFSAPWDEPSSAVIDPMTDVIDPSSAVIDDAVTDSHAASPYGFDKLRGVSLKQFKDQLGRQGVTPESGAFKSVELLQNPGTALFIERRMMAFWTEFGSTRIPHAVYFVFGLQDGGNRSPEFKEQYEVAKVWVSNWIKENLPND